MMVSFWQKTWVMLAGVSLLGASAGLPKAAEPAKEGGAPMKIELKAEQAEIGMGRSVTLTATVTRSDGQPASGTLLLPYADGKRWGAHEFADAQGHATFHIPLPNPGLIELQLEARPGEKFLAEYSQPVDRTPLLIGGRPPEGATLSAPATVRVNFRQLRTLPADPEHLVGAQWEPWFTPMNAHWQTAQAVPMMGFYDSWNTDVTRQHILWFMESGVDVLYADWTNHLWDKKHWDERGDNCNEIIHATTMALEEMARMRDEGLPVPKMVLLLGIINGPPTTQEAVNEEMAWVYHNYVRNPRFKGLFVDYLGKPLIVIFNGGGPEWLKKTQTVPPDETHFTVRWMSFAHNITKQNEAGYWSWMDGALEQPVTMFQGKPEVMTVCAGMFNGGGWKAPDAYGHRNGWTYVESFKGALKHRPKFVQLHQFQEYAGAVEGQGFGPNKDIYVDSYSEELSDDFEPVSLTAPAYRGEGGWGYLPLNLTRAMVDLYRQPADSPQTTVMAIGNPLRRAVVTSPTLTVTWTAIGKPASGYTVTLNGQPVKVEAKTVAHGMEASLDLTKVPEGPATLRITGEGTQCRYLPSYTEDSLPLDQPVPAYAEVAFTVKHQ